MLDLKFILENTEIIEKNSKDRGAIIHLAEIGALYEDKKKMASKIDDLRSQRNTISKQKPSEDDITLARKLNCEIKQMDAILEDLGQKLNEFVCDVPNLTHPDSPRGGESDFKEIYRNKEVVKFDFVPKDHDDLMNAHDLIDFARGAKVAGSKFYFIKNQMVRLNQALLNYGLDICEKHGYTLMETPDMVKSAILAGSGFNPRGEEKQTYEIKNTDLDLVGTAEITILGFHSDEVLNLNQGPIKYAALSHCYRTEAGSYGKATKGLYRVHQFAKLEMFVFCRPQESEDIHQEILSIEKEIVDGLEIPYRVIDIATGDLGAPAYRKYDLEAWMTMKGDGKKKQGDYGEITSASNCTDYQARRLNIKYKEEDGKMKYVHTLNGTAVVLSRFPIALIENHQQADGSIVIPPALKKYIGFEKIAI
ncbi:MAG: serine--tRNA ligase [bacterium]